VQPLGQRTIRRRHIGDSGEHRLLIVDFAGAFAAACGGFQLLGTLPHRGLFFLGEFPGQPLGGCAFAGRFAGAFFLWHVRLLC